MNTTTFSDLESAAQAFDDFRAHRRHVRQAIPQALKTQALDLKHRYGYAVVCQKLGIGYSTLSSWSAQSKAVPETEFLPLKAPADDVIELKLGDVRIAFSPGQMDVLADLLVRLRVGA